jgi:stage III sporulation protein AA
MRTDVLDACPKIEGMRMLLRSMAPDVIAVDEIGSLEDVVALKEVLGAGVAILATVHGLNVEDCKKRPALRQLLEQELFHKVVVLSNRRGPCTVELIDALIYPSETLLNL